MSSHKHVLVIGCGPAGIAQMVDFQQLANPLVKVTCFEQGSEMGGLWTWSDKVGDEVHQSMYRYHQTNGLNEMLELPDYSFVEHFGYAITSYPPRAVMLDYLHGWARKWKIDVTLNRKVVKLTYNDKTAKFTACSEDTRNASHHWNYFDYVIVATGHFSRPNYIPPYPGMEHFDGFAIHSHNFRDARDHAGQSIMVIGNGYSGEDISMQCVKFGARKCTVCYLDAVGPMPHNFGTMPIVDSRLPTHYDPESKDWVFPCGRREKFDGIIYCTGYVHSFPFLPENLQLRTPNRLIPNTLWKGILHPENPALMFLGMPDQYYTFSAFHAQGKFTAGVVEGRVAIPSKEEMVADTKKWQEREDGLDHTARKHHRFQYEHTEEAAALAGGHLRNDEALFDQWADDRASNILTYRDQGAVSPVSGVASLTFGVPWERMFTDDKVAYLAWCKAEYDSLQAKTTRSKL